MDKVFLSTTQMPRHSAVMILRVGVSIFTSERWGNDILSLSLSRSIYTSESTACWVHRDRLSVGFTAIPIQSEHITTNVVSSNPTDGDKVCHWFAVGGWFSPVIPVSSNNKTDRHDIIEILLKVALNTITLSL